MIHCTFDVGQSKEQLTKRCFIQPASGSVWSRISRHRSRYFQKKGASLAHHAPVHVTTGEQPQYPQCSRPGNQGRQPACSRSPDRAHTPEQQAGPPKSSFAEYKIRVWTTPDEAHQCEHLIVGNPLPSTNRFAIPPDLLMHGFAKSQTLVPQLTDQLRIQLCRRRIYCSDGFEQRQWQPGILRLAGQSEHDVQLLSGAAGAAIGDR